MFENSQFSLLVNLGGFEGQDMIVKIHQVSGAMWIRLGIKNCLEKTKNSPFTQKSEVSLQA